MSLRPILKADIKDLSETITDDLRCSICDKYLTVLPILLRQSGDSICGRCAPPSDERLSVVRNIAYERLVTKIVFPCSYEEEGCTYRDEAINLLAHENFCPFRTICCPFLPLRSCDWHGCQTSLLDHYQKSHSRYIVTSHPCNVKPPTLAKNMEDCLLISLYNKLFILQIRFGVSSARYAYDVRIVDIPAESRYFQYKFEVISIGKGNYVNVCNVLEQEKFQLSDDSKNQFNMEYLHKFFGRLEYLSFQITITHRENVIKCIDCYRNTFTHELSHGFCTYCDQPINMDLYPLDAKTQNVKCNYSNEGCLYFDKRINMKKHETWFCEFAENKCTICEKQVKNLFNHYFVNHQGQVFTDKITQNNLSLNKKYSAVLIHENASFLALWNFSRSFLEIKVISNLPKSDNSYFDCILKLTNPKSMFSKKYRLPVCNLNGVCDWLGIIRYNSNNLVVSTVIDAKENMKSSANECALKKTPADINVCNSYNLMLMVLKKYEE